MGIRGRKPRPTAAKLRAGKPGHRPLPKNEPQAVDHDPLDPPIWLRERSRAVWREVAPILSDLGLLTAADVHSVAQYCMALADLIESEEKLRRGRLVDRKGKVKGWYRVRAEADKRARLWAAQLGLDATSRTRIEPQVPRKPRKDGFQFDRHKLRAVK